jgi:hypothetical protein
MYASGKKACVAIMAKGAEERKQACKSSEFGCRQCLWCSCECHGMSKYAPKVVVTDNLRPHESCEYYSYYD